MLLIRRFNISQYVLGALRGSLSLSHICLIYLPFAVKIAFVHSFDLAITLSKSDFVLPFLQCFLVSFDVFLLIWFLLSLPVDKLLSLSVNQFCC